MVNCRFNTNSDIDCFDGSNINVICQKRASTKQSNTRKRKSNKRIRAITF